MSFLRKAVCALCLCAVFLAGMSIGGFSAFGASLLDATKSHALEAYRNRESFAGKARQVISDQSASLGELNTRVLTAARDLRQR